MSTYEFFLLVLSTAGWGVAGWALAKAEAAQRRERELLDALDRKP